jgi:hypothetical protein
MRLLILWSEAIATEVAHSIGVTIAPRIKPAPHAKSWEAEEDQPKSRGPLDAYSMRTLAAIVLLIVLPLLVALADLYMLGMLTLPPG